MELSFSKIRYLFVRSGTVNLDILDGTSRYGYVWSRTAHQNNYQAYFLGLAYEAINPVNNASRYYAFPLRCLAS